MRELMVYNTLTRKKEKFVPVTPGQVKMYVCGITPYNHSHMGNARPFVTWDVIKRYLEHLGYEVLHIQNFTDVDDKIINAANGIRFPIGTLRLISKLWMRFTYVAPTSIRAFPII